MTSVCFCSLFEFIKRLPQLISIRFATRPQNPSPVWKSMSRIVLSCAVVAVAGGVMYYAYQYWRSPCTPPTAVPSSTPTSNTPATTTATAVPSTTAAVSTLTLAASSSLPVPASTTTNVVSLPTVLKNYYFIVRHGESEANVAGIISSDPAVACTSHGLTETGREQAINAAANVSELVGARSLVILSSDFKRYPSCVLSRMMIAHLRCPRSVRLRVCVGCSASETATVIKERLRSRNAVRLHPGLRERYFGTFEAQPNTHYHDVWSADQKLGSFHHSFGAESCAEVLKRVVDVIRECEDTYHNCGIVMVSHGDTLQILQTAFTYAPSTNTADNNGATAAKSEASKPAPQFLPPHSSIAAAFTEL